MIGAKSPCQQVSVISFKTVVSFYGLLVLESHL